MWKLLALCAVLSFVAASSADAAQFNVVLAQYHGPEMGLLVQGPIGQGGGQLFRKALEGAIKKYRDHRMRIVSLNSSGGVISEALTMAQLIHSRGLATIVSDNAICVSACVLVFASGNQKTFSSSARIGVHGASTEGRQQDTGALAVTTDLAKLYGAFGVPDTVIARMVVTAPEDISWLTYKDLVLFPNAGNFNSTDVDFPEVGSGFDGVSIPLRATGRNDEVFKEGFEYGYNNYGGCGTIMGTLHRGFDEWDDLTNGCNAGLDALRREHQTMVPLAPSAQSTTFGAPPPHSAALLREASEFMTAFEDGYSNAQSADCKKYKALADVCQTGIDRRARANAGAEPPLSDAQIEKDFGPQQWLDAYDWEYTHHEIWCGVIRAPSTLGCEAAERDWPRAERSGR